MIDLSSNENPYEPSKRVIEAVMQSAFHLNRYVGHGELDALKEAISDYNQVSKERIFVGPGTDYLFKETIFNFAKNKDVITFNPSFFGSVESAKYTAKRIMKIQLVPPEYKINLEALTGGPSLMLLDSPNNPTGRCLIERKQLIEILGNSDNLVLIDEAYYEFSKKSFVDLVEKYPNLAIARTLDKAFSLAGLRVSYLIAGDRFLRRLSSHAQVVNRPACRAAITAIKDKAYAFNNVKIIINERERLRGELEMAGLAVTPSQTNFLLVRTSIPEFALRLNKENILISDLSDTWLKNCYRISVGNQWENDLLLNAIRKFTSVD